ncbi:MAG: oligosaccharide flippase family protein [Candidatus Shapirobacteria bacterium]|nr:oligosaccharide flippase family protein [Candidatus Shapirobacteria bacterium]
MYMMLSTGIMAFFGFFFWIINARLFTPEQVGIATTLISVTGLIGGFSILGLNMGLIKYLPHSDNKNSKINSSFNINAIVSVLITIIFLIGLKFFSPKLLFLNSNLFYAITFIVFITATSLNTLVESVFVAYRSAKHILLKNFVLSVIKLGLPIFLVVFSAYGIFTAVGIANVIAFIFSIFLLIRNFNYQYKLEVDIKRLKKMASFSFGNYVAGFIGGFPAMVLPVIITNKINPQSTAYYYIAMMIANLIFIIPQATTQSLFAEGSHSETEMKDHIGKSIKIIAIILIPTIIITLLAGKYVLLVFGKSYSSEAFVFLQLLAVSSLFVAANSIFGTVLRVKNKIKGLIAASTINTVVVLALSYLLIEIKLLGIGIAWIVGQIATLIVYLYLLKFKQNSN